jgi:hypothetical protein
MTVQQISRDGIVPSYDAGDAVNGHEFANNGKTFLHVKNGGGSSINVTIPTPGSVDGLAVAERIVAVAAGAEKMMGPFPTATYNQAGGLVYVDLSDATSVTLDAFRI